MAGDQRLDIIRALPKVDLHRHLEGSVRLTTLIDIAREYGIEMPEYDIETLRPFVQVMPGEMRSPQHFLNKFATLRQFFRSPEVIQRVTRETVADAAADQVRYLELRFTPAALSNILRCAYEDVIAWVCEAAVEAADAHGIQVSMIVSMNRHESAETGQRVLQAALALQHQGVAALDLAGNEWQYPSHPFYDIFETAHAAGLGITIHAGEWAGADSIREALDRLHANRIGHGVRAVEDPSTVAELAARGTVLEVCPSSNLDSGVVQDWNVHPLAELYRQHVKTTLNTDDPLISGISLSDEIDRVIEHFGWSLADIKQHMLNAVSAAFLPAAERDILAARFEQWWAGV